MSKNKLRIPVVGNQGLTLYQLIKLLLLDVSLDEGSLTKLSGVRRIIETRVYQSAGAELVSITDIILLNICLISICCKVN